MKGWQEQLLSALSATKTVEEIFAVITREARALGFDNCAYGVRLPLPLARPRTVMYNDYPIAWQERYLQENYVDIDPIVKHGKISRIPLVWSDSLFSQQPDFWEEARSFGLIAGWSQASADDTGVQGLLTLVRAGQPMSPKEVDLNGFRMAWLTQMGHLYMSKLIVARLVPETQIQLSSREKEVLRWTAEGKTSSEISDILNLSVRTVNFHVTNAMAKLNCANKTAATVKAAVLGFLC
jgi:LuxR family transcriptional regulator